VRESWALIRSAWLTAASYRMAMFISLFGLVFVLLPLYFIANALQPAMQQTISGEARQYFGFVVLGAICFSLVSTCTTSLPSAIDGAIGRGAPIETQIYPGAYHAFDAPNQPRRELPDYRTRAGVVPIIGTDPAARQDVLTRVPAFLARYLTTQ